MMAWKMIIAADPSGFSFLAESGFSDIREIVRLPNYWPWLAAAVALCALAALVCGWRRFRRGAAPAPAPAEPQHEKALRLLHALRERGAELEAERFTVEVSAILRHYLEDALDVPAPEQTSEEFLRELRGQPWLTRELHADLEEFMRLADLVKFARQSLDAGQRQRLLDSAIQVVEATRPEPEPVPSAR